MVPRILLLIVIILALVIGGIFWFDFLGLVNARSYLGWAINPVMGLFGQKPPVSVNIDDPVLLDSIRIRKQEEALDLKYQELISRQDELAKLDQGISQKTADIGEREKAQDDREKSFNEKLKAYDNRKANLVRISQDLTSMKPAAAVKIMNGYDDQLLIDILRTTQELADAAGATSLVSVWLSQLDPARAAEIQRKMTLKPPATE
jgi:flagellar protein FlbB